MRHTKSSIVIESGVTSQCKPRCAQGTEDKSTSHQAAQASFKFAPCSIEVSMLVNAAYKDNIRGARDVQERCVTVCCPDIELRGGFTKILFKQLTPLP